MTHIFSLRRKAMLTTAAAVAAFSLPGIAAADPPSPASSDPREARIEQLEAEVQNLASEVRGLKRAQEAPRTRVVADAGAAPGGGSPASDAVATIAQGHPAIASDDGRFTANFHGIL